MIQVQSFGITDPGREREGNEDSILLDQELDLYVVCDGMGGSVHGETASENAAEAVQEFIRANRGRLEQIDDAGRGAAAVELVKEALQYACARLRTLVKERPECSGMGTTLTMLFLDGTRGVMGHVGDSRLYLKRDTTVHQLSKDHSLVGELLQANEISPEDAVRHPFSHVLTRAMGRDTSVLADTLLFDLLPGDLFMICTDGLWASFPRAESLLPLLDEKALQASATSILEHAKTQDGSDNLSVIVVRVSEGTEAVEQERYRQQFVMLQIETLQQVYLFESLPLDAIFNVVEISRVYDAKENQLLIREGEQTSSMFILLDGAVSVSRGGVELAKFGPGAHFGEMALLSATERSASVRAVKPSRLLVIDQQAFRKLVHREPILGVSLLWRLGAELSTRLYETNKQIHW